MARLLRSLFARASLCALGLQALSEAPFNVATAQAEPAPAAPAKDAKQAAALAYDRGIALFNQADFAAAARAFLEADALSASSQAITNAIAAARKANDHLLVARVAQRAIDRDDSAAPAARAALADAATHLARLELGCSNAPCAFVIDGAPAGAVIAFVLPGDHVVRATDARGGKAEQRVQAGAGATYKVLVELTPASPQNAAKPGVPAPRKGLPRAVFLAGLGATVVLGGVTVWSGVDAIQAKGALPAAPEQAQNDAVLAKARRTDFLLLGAGLAGIGAAVVGLGFTDWAGEPVVAFVAPANGGVFAGARATF